jgi:hypothetical protein
VAAKSPSSGSRRGLLTGRRGVLAGAVALASAGIAKLSNVQPAHAADGGNMIIGANNTSTTVTQLNRSGGAATAALSVTNAAGAAIIAQVNAGGGQGIFANTQGGNGVQAFTAANDAIYGESANGSGVVGVSTGNGAGVAAFTSATTAVSAQSTSGSGVSGRSTSGVGGGFSSSTAAGLLALSNSGRAIIAQSGSNSAILAQSFTGFAGEFVGPVTITGALTVTGDFSATGMKSALVKQDDGTYNRLYCLESPDSLFEDFGEASLSNGRVLVGIAKDFMAVAKTGEAYLVYLTPEDNCNGLYVGNKTADAFEVREFGGGTSNARFSYRIVAKRADVDATRSAKVEVHSPQRIQVEAIPAVKPPTPSERPR